MGALTILGVVAGATWVVLYVLAWLRRRRPGDYVYVETEWADVDDGPEWMPMDDLGYRGGGVMGRRRPPVVRVERYTDGINEREDEE